MIGGRPMRYVPFNPWESFRQMESEMSRLMNDVLEVSSGYPARNIWYNDTGAYVVAELPGVSPDNIEANVVGKDTLVVKGTRNAPETKESEKMISEGRQFGTFMRSISLPFDIDEQGMKADLVDGCLLLWLPRKAEEHPKRIQIKTN